MLLDFVERVRATVDWEKMPGDPMFGGGEEHYRGVGESALKVILGSHLLAEGRAYVDPGFRLRDRTRHALAPCGIPIR